MVLIMPVDTPASDFEERAFHAYARMIAEELKRQGHKPDKKLLRFNDIVHAAIAAYATITRPMTISEQANTKIAIIFEMTAMCFSTIDDLYIPGKGPLHELELYKAWN